jgi:excisionase family DNA binding protein
MLQETLRGVQQILGRLDLIEAHLRQQTPEPAGEWITVPEAARRLDMTEKTLRRLIDSGEIPALRPAGARVVRINTNDLAHLGRAESA